uniref:DCD domain-containing protein n=1 Tax=Leersia perrieri TaxID=77586 RepID=A0A0D9WI91_9ORYZ
MDNLWHLGDEFRGHSKVVEDRQWSLMTSKLAEINKLKAERTNDLDYARMNTVPDVKQWDKLSYHQDENKMDHLNLGLMNLDLKMNDLRMNEAAMKNSFRSMAYSMNQLYPKGSNGNVNAFKMNVGVNKYSHSPNGKEGNGKNSGGNSNGSNSSGNNSAVDKRFKTLPTSEMLPRNEVLGGYIFVCNNDTMQEDLKRQLFGLPARYRDSVRAITPGLPLFLYNYTTHQLHGAASFGGSNIDPTAWEDKKCKGESRFPAQVRIRIRKLCKPLEEDAFRPVLHHYDGPKFRLELSIAEAKPINP